MTKPKKRLILIVAVVLALAVAAGSVAYTMKYFRYPRVAVKGETAMQIFTDCFEEANRRFGFSFEPYNPLEDSPELSVLCGETTLETGEILSLEFSTISIFLDCTVVVHDRTWDTWEEAYAFLQQRDLEQYTQVYDLVSYLSDGLYTGNSFKKTLGKMQKKIVQTFPENHEITVSEDSTNYLSLYFPNVNSAYAWYEVWQDEETGKWTASFGVGTGLYAE